MSIVFCIFVKSEDVEEKARKRERERDMRGGRKKGQKKSERKVEIFLTEIWCREKVSAEYGIVVILAVVYLSLSLLRRQLPRQREPWNGDRLKAYLVRGSRGRSMSKYAIMLYNNNQI